MLFLTNNVMLSMVEKKVILSIGYTTRKKEEKRHANLILEWIKDVPLLIITRFVYCLRRQIPIC